MVFTPAIDDMDKLYVPYPCRTSDRASSRLKGLPTAVELSLPESGKWRHPQSHEETSYFPSFFLVRCGEEGDGGKE